MILNRQRRIRVALPPLRDFLARVRKELNLGPGEVSVCLVADSEIARLNRQFRGKRGPTDVLSFPANGRAPLRRSAPASKAARYLGDIAISPQTARRNARRLGRPLGGELRVLILHGVLHLLGHDHETDRGEMERLEHRLRGRLGLR
jgi:probable rRNA maturation factor